MNYHQFHPKNAARKLWFIYKDNVVTWEINVKWSESTHPTCSLLTGIMACSDKSCFMMSWATLILQSWELVHKRHVDFHYLIHLAHCDGIIINCFTFQYLNLSYHDLALFLRLVPWEELSTMKNNPSRSALQGANSYTQEV